MGKPVTRETLTREHLLEVLALGQRFEDERACHMAQIALGTPPSEWSAWARITQDGALGHCVSIWNAYHSGITVEDIQHIFDEADHRAEQCWAAINGDEKARAWVSEFCLGAEAKR